ncbi:hypothetical protein TIFTF001_002736 [Ficus carica]|uniref:OTU domain-containing protein n=1 Tax=Ficus carica TaxID=3494 RepID=A0AA88CU24_FICCA|nr:hypothetical protein TIFTF001_002736 [Ficus carica]
MQNLVTKCRSTLCLLEHIVGQSDSGAVADWEFKESAISFWGKGIKFLITKFHNSIKIKKHGKEADISQFRAQLDALGLKIVQVTADGNCFFRALADQLEGDEEEHVKYRSMVENREMFEPFIEDDVPFDEYCQSMEKDGTWAGHMELQAASLVTRTNICIHRSMSPRWYIRNFDDSGVRMVHLSYHDGEHYNSVRLKEDSCEGPARPIVIKVDIDISMKSHQPRVADGKSNGGAGRNIINAGSIKLVIAGTGCEDAEKVEKVLREVDGDVDAAIEFLVAEQSTEECSVRPDSPPNQTDTSTCNSHCEENGKYGQEMKQVEETFEQDVASSGNSLAHNNSSSQPDKISRNQFCPCGSKKKYKSCCGAVNGRSSNKFVV